MKRLVLAFLFSSTLLGGIEYPEIIADYMSGIEFKEQEQHDRVERALLYLEGMDRDDLCMVAGYLCMILDRPVVEEDCGCDCCCDDVIDQMIEQEYANCGMCL
jgi:hypothetical protein